MTKYELNKRLAELCEIIPPNSVWIENCNLFGSGTGKAEMWLDAHKGKYRAATFDYLSNWDYLMPLVVEHGITNLHLGDNEWEVSFDFKGDMDINGTDEILSHAIECKGDQLQEIIVKCLIAKLEGESKS